jgi:DNA ligase D-like protein (predicted polymerase)
MPSKPKQELLSVAGREVAISNPEKIFFPEARITKLELVRYYLAVAEGAIRGVAGRPMALKRFVNGIKQEYFFQKRAPEKKPEWIETVELKFPSGRTANEIVIRDAAQLAWILNLGVVDLNPHPIRADDLDHPDELRIDLDPIPGVEWPQIRDVALTARAVLEEHGLVAWPKTSGSRGIHVYARIHRRWEFGDVRKAALAVAREVERRMPGRATSRWWKEEREGVFLDYNQNAKDRTVASAYSVRPLADARVSAPLFWSEVPDCDPRAFTLRTVPERFAKLGDPSKGIDEAPGSLEPLLELSRKQEQGGQGEAPWPPHYPKQAGEPPRVQPSKKKKAPVVIPKKPLLVIARAQGKDDALAGLERWKARHPEVIPHLAAKDYLVDAMRGRSTAWYRIRINLESVPEEKRPAAEPPDPDFDPKTAR